MHAPSPAAATRTLGMSACVGGISGWDEKMEEGGEGTHSLGEGGGGGAAGNSWLRRWRERAREINGRPQAMATRQAGTETLS